MNELRLSLCLFLILSPNISLADFYYVETTKTISKGMPGATGMPGMDHLGKDRNQSQSRHIYIKGLKQATYNNNGSLDTVMDFDSGRIIVANDDDRAYVDTTMKDYYEKMLESSFDKLKEKTGSKKKMDPNSFKFSYSYKKLNKTKKILGMDCALYNATMTMKGVIANSGPATMKSKSKECWMLSAPAEVRSIEKKMQEWWTSSDLGEKLKKSYSPETANPMIASVLQSMEDMPSELQSAWKIYEERTMEMPPEILQGLGGGKGKGKGMSKAETTQIRNMMAAMMPKIVTSISKVSRSKIPDSKFTAPAGFRKLSLSDYFKSE